MKQLEGRVAVVTGGGGGIGRGLVLAFAKAGMKVAVADIDAGAAEAVAEEARALGADALGQAVDVVERSDLESLASRVADELGSVRLLCNNAGVTTFGMICDGIPDDDWSWVLGVNLQGVINGLQTFIPGMRELEGEKHVVNTASIAGVSASPFVAPYAASKHAVVGLSDTLRAEGVAHGISCSVLCPDAVKTGICDSERNRHEDFGGPRPVSNEMIAAHIENAGIDPLRVGELVRQAVIDDIPFIFTHQATKALIEARHKAMTDSMAWAETWENANPE